MLHLLLFARWRRAQEGALSYLGEQGTLLYLYLTHRLVSLGGRDGCPVRPSATVHCALYGRTSPEAVEAAYDRVAATFDIFSGPSST